MADPESFEQRARRLRQATEGLSPPPDLARRIVEAALTGSSRQGWSFGLLAVGRRSLLFAACAAALSLVLAYSSERQLEEAIAWTTFLEGPE